MSSPKTHYLPILYNLTFVSLFGGLFSFLALILSPPPCTTTLSRLKGLLTIPTLFFLANALTTLLLLVTLLHPLHAYQLVSGWRRHLLHYGIAIIYLFLLIAFIHLATAVQAINDGPSALGYLGIALFSFITLGIVILGLSTRGPEFESENSGVTDEGSRQLKGRGEDNESESVVVRRRRGEYPLTPLRNATSEEEQEHGSREKKWKVEELGWWRVVVVLSVYVVEVALAIAIMVEGGGAALKGGVNSVVCRELSVGVVGGGLGTKGNPIMVDVVGGDEAVSVLFSITETVFVSSEDSVSQSVSVTVKESGQGKASVATVVDWTSVTSLVTVTV